MHCMQSMHLEPGKIRVAATARLPLLEIPIAAFQSSTVQGLIVTRGVMKGDEAQRRV